MAEPILVVAAVRRLGALYWTCRRTGDGAHGGLAGFWEYPGGKVEPGEAPAQALKREMREEFGVECAVGNLLDDITTVTAEQPYRVLFYAVTFGGLPRLRVHSDAQWCTLEQLLAQQHLPSGTEFNRRQRDYENGWVNGGAR